MPSSLYSSRSSCRSPRRELSLSAFKISGGIPLLPGAFPQASETIPQAAATCNNIIIIIVIIIIIIIYLFYQSLSCCFFVHQPGAYHGPGASDTQVIHSDHTLSTFLRIRADPSMLIFGSLSQ